MLTAIFAALKRKIEPFFAARVSNDSAKKYLSNLREQELSVGAALRRGEVVKTAPGQIWDATKTIAAEKHSTNHAGNRNSVESRSTPQSSQEKQDKELGFATSLAVTMATDSPVLGYAAGGSFSGAAAGAILSDYASKDDQ